jgi:hypothetical protein
LRAERALKRAVSLATVLLAASVSPAQDAGSEKARLAPRPGMEWQDQAPAKGAAPLKLAVRGAETSVYRLGPGERLDVPVPGPNARLLIHSRRLFSAVSDPPAAYSFAWQRDAHPPREARFRSAPQADATLQGDPAIPGTRDPLVIDVPEDGAHLVRISVPEDAPAALTFRFYVEVPKPPSEARRLGRVHTDHWWMKTWTRLRIAYDDNLFRFDDEDVHAFEEENTNHPYDKYDKIDSVDDWVTVSELELVLVSPRTSLGRFTIGGEYTEWFHANNHVKNTREYDLYVRHRPGAGFGYEVFGSWRPDVFVRNFDSPDTAGSSLSHAHYDRYELSARAWARLAKPLRATFEYEWELDDYNSKFNERDLKADSFEVGLRWRPAAWVSLDLEYRWTHARALAKGDEPDRSYRQSSPGIELEFTAGKLFFGGSYRYAERVYTTTNDSAVDPLHAGRRDRTHEWTAGVGYRLSEKTTVRLEYTRTKRTSRVNGLQSSTDPADVDDEFEYDANRYEFSYEFEFP